MSGHSKWHSIKHKKGAADAKRGKIFTKHAKFITIAAREGGGDAEMNPALRMAVEKAKAENMPNDNIERAIKKGTGEDKGGAVIEEVIYEGYGPNGIALLIQVLTDNKNRTVSNVRTILDKNGGSLGSSGCVAWMFKKQGVISLGQNTEELQLTAIEAGADDVQEEGSGLEVITKPENFLTVKKALEEAGAPIESAEVQQIPENTVKVEDEETAKKILRLMDALDEDEDVSEVSANFDISEEIMEKVV